MREGEPSVTARHVAARRLTFAREPAVGRPGDDDVLGRDVALGVEQREGRLHEYLRARTAFFDRAVVGALDDGLTQVVLVGAGYDGRALRYAREGARFFEVDHPATQADKRARLARLGLDAGDVVFVAIDLSTDDLVTSLAAAGHARDRASLFTVEGLSSYLEEDVLAALLGDLRTLAGPGSRLAISVGAGATAEGRDPGWSARFRARVASVGEPIRNNLGADGVAPLLTAARWRTQDPGPVQERFGLVLAHAAVS